MLPVNKIVKNINADERLKDSRNEFKTDNKRLNNIFNLENLSKKVKRINKSFIEEFISLKNQFDRFNDVIKIKTTFHERFCNFYFVI